MGEARSAVSPLCSHTPSPQRRSEIGVPLLFDKEPFTGEGGVAPVPRRLSTSFLPATSRSSIWKPSPCFLPLLKRLVVISSQYARADSASPPPSPFDCTRSTGLESWVCVFLPGTFSTADSTFLPPALGVNTGPASLSIPGMRYREVRGHGVVGVSP